MYHVLIIVTTHNKAYLGHVHESMIAQTGPFAVAEFARLDKSMYAQAEIGRRENTVQYTKDVR